MKLIPDFFKFWQQNEIDDTEKYDNESVAPPSKNDGATEIETHEDMGPMGGALMHGQTFIPSLKNTKDVINQYRTIAQFHKVDDAVQEITDDAIVHEDGKDVVSIDVESAQISDALKEKIREEFKTVLRLFDFDNQGTDIFRRWYIDSRIYFHKIVDNKKNGIKELRRLDPRTLEFVREIKKTRQNGVDIVKGIEEYFIYSPTTVDHRYGQFNPGSTQRIKIPKDAIVYAHSGITDVDGKTIIGHLHRAIKPANMLIMLQDALVIYRIARAPERRAFYIDVGNMQGKKASQYVNSVMASMKNRMVYDSSTGKVKSSSNQLSMMEDFFLMRRDGKTATEIDTLPGGQSLGEMDDVMYFNKELYTALNIPLTRIPREDGVVFGGNNEITRDELSFTKFVRRLQNQFKKIFIEVLITNLILKGIMTRKEWDKISYDIDVIFNKDSRFEELQQLEVLERRLTALEGAGSIIGKYMSHDTAQKLILKMTEDEIKEEAKKIEEEKKEKRFASDDDEYGL